MTITESMERLHTRKKVKRLELHSLKNRCVYKITNSIKQCSWSQELGNVQRKPEVLYLNSSFSLLCSILLFSLISISSDGKSDWLKAFSKWGLNVEQRHTSTMSAHTQQQKWGDSLFKNDVWCWKKLWWCGGTAVWWCSRSGRNHSLPSGLQSRLSKMPWHSDIRNWNL